MMTGKQILYGLGLALAFGIGCGAGAGASAIVVPPVRAGTNPQRWEHLCRGSDSRAELNEIAKRAGTEGWEMVSVSVAGGGALVCFKRPL